MIKIRLARTGSTHNPHYRIVAADSRERRDGRFLEIIGSYHPLQQNATIVNQERASYWLSVGAQPSNTVISLLTKAGVKHSFAPRRKPQRQAEPAATTEAVAKPDATEAGDEVIAEAPLSDEAAVESAEQPASENA
jgi:small subunit ribosomal protein S16